MRKIFNKAFVQNQFPIRLKIGVVKPTSKEGDGKDVNNYRRIIPMNAMHMECWKKK